MWRVVLPNIRSAVLSAAFLTVALVLGEFTIASLLNRTNLQVAINLLGKSSATMSVAVSLAALLLAFVLLLLLSLFGRLERKAKIPMTGVAVHLNELRRTLRRACTPSTASTCRIAAGRADRPARAVRLRQDHRAAHPGRAGGRRQRPGPGRRARTSPRCRPTAATWAWCSRRTACSRT